MALQKKSAACEIFFKEKRFEKFVPGILRTLSLSLRALEVNRVSIEISCLSDSEMAKINAKYKKKRGPATVLSFPVSGVDFPHPESSRGRRYIGEIFLAPDYILKKRKEPLARFVIHGLLHLLGYTHSRQSDRIDMETLEEDLKAHLQSKGAWE
jgi:rRNA maturation RNase YbeY